MNLNPTKTAKKIVRLLEEERKLDIPALKTIYDDVLRLRSQIIAGIYDLEQFGCREIEAEHSPAVCQIPSANKQAVILTIPESLPASKELTMAIEEHWVAMIHKAIDKEAETGIPFWEKAYVCIDITTAKGTPNSKVWDVSNRSINVIINNLKGIFFPDDDFAHLSCGIEARWGEIEETNIFICAHEDRYNSELFKKQRKLHDLSRLVMEKRNPSEKKLLSSRLI